MGKTCTSPFTGGQCDNGVYSLIVNFGKIQWSDSTGRIVNGSGSASARGPIIEVGVVYINNATRIITKLKVGDTIPAGISVDVRLQIVDKNGTTNWVTSLNGFAGFKLIKFEYILNGPNCGDRPEVCKCDPTDQTIACPGQSGGICCIAKSKIANWCATLEGLALNLLIMRSLYLSSSDRFIIFCLEFYRKSNLTSNPTLLVRRHNLTFNSFLKPFFLVRIAIISHRDKRIMNDDYLVFKVTFIS
jgi:hypothetical protein